MPEIKHDFSAGKMNKDLDERIVPNGSYRNAVNIQVRTTSGDGAGVGDGGTVQNLQGNKRVIEAITTGKVNYEKSYVENSSFGRNESRFIGSVASEKNNSIYFLLASPNLNIIKDTLVNNVSAIKRSIKFTDNIIEHNIKQNSIIPVFTDSYALIDQKKNVIDVSEGDDNFTYTWQDAGEDAYPPNQLLPVSGTTFTSIKIQQDVFDFIKIGMTVTAYQLDGSISFSGEIQDMDSDQNIISFYDPIASLSWLDVNHFLFEAPRVLNFDNKSYVTGINIIDDLLFWTDNISEPKKINITRSKEGTKTFTSHTQLKLADPKDGDVLWDFVEVQNSGNQFHEQPLSPTINNDVKEEHITVIKKAPLTAPVIQMRDSDRDLDTEVTEFIYNFATYVSGASNILVGTELTIPHAFDIDNDATTFSNSNMSVSNDPTIFNNVDLRVGDIIKFSETNGDFESYLKAVITSVTWTGGETGDGYKVIGITILSINKPLTPTIYNDSGDGGEVLPVVAGSGIWKITLDRKDPLFELKFGRFGLRYKYEDGEYSNYGPWSEIAFIPGAFDLDHKRGYNVGMGNNIRSLKIKNIIPHQRVKPNDMVAIDILYKNTESPNVYVVKTICRGKDPEWNLFNDPMEATSNTGEYVYEFSLDGDVVVQDTFKLKDGLSFGQLDITSEMIHKSLPANQTLRAWDNVPLKALAQEIAANRLVYGNFEFGYEIQNTPGLKQSLVTNRDGTPSIETPKKSLKSIRDYNIGMVFGDKYGRETPVISPGYVNEIVVGNQSRFEVVDGNIKVKKADAPNSSRLKLEQMWGQDFDSIPDSWITYVKYYIKETTNEYYNVVMDRWYDAEDSNIWLSFSSADRNKLDEETYLILKNEHGYNTPVIEKGRYKVLAIENEAPDFIKKKYKDMGQVEISGPDNTYSIAEYILQGGTTYEETLSVAPFKLQSTQKIAIGAEAWNGFLDGYDMMGGDGDLEVRVAAAAGPESNPVQEVAHINGWRLVTYVHKKECTQSQIDAGTCEDEGVAGVRWDKPFGSGADMQEALVTAGQPNPLTEIRYYLQFREVVTKNKPEFDGKFFVKIEKDDLLKQKVLGVSAEAIDYDTTNIIPISYIENAEFNPSALNSIDNDSMPRKNYKWFHDQNGEVFQDINYDGDSSDVDEIAAGIINAPVSTTPGEIVSSIGLADWSNGERCRGTNSGGDINDGCSARDAEFFAMGCSDGDGLAGTGTYITDAADRDTLNVIYNRALETRNFWNWYRLDASNSHGATVFIDGFRALRARKVPDSSDIESWGAPGNTSNWIETNGNQINLESNLWKPGALEEGQLENDPGSNELFGVTPAGQLGRMTLGTLGSFDTTDGTDEYDLVQAFTNYGTLFTFQDDPNNVVYKVVSRPQDVFHWQYRNHNHTVPDASNNNPASTTNDLCNFFNYSEQSTQWGNFQYNGWYGAGNEGSYPPTATSSNCNNQAITWNGVASPDESWVEVNWLGDNNPVLPSDSSNEMIVNAVDSFIKIGGWKYPGGAQDGVSGFSCVDCGDGFDLGTGVSDDNGFTGTFYGTFNDGGSPTCRRSGFTFEFRRFNTNTNGLFKSDSGVPGVLGVDIDQWDPRGAICHDGRESMNIEIVLGSLIQGETVIPTKDAAIWETEPKEDVGLELYYEASDAIPTVLTSENTPNFIPWGCKVEFLTYNNGQYVPVEGSNFVDTSDLSNIQLWINDLLYVDHIGYTKTNSVVGIKAPYGTLANFATQTNYTNQNLTLGLDLSLNDYYVRFSHSNGTKTMSKIVSHMQPTGVVNNLTETIFETSATQTGYFKLDSDVWKFPIELGWFNCYTWGNGVESDRIRDDFNANTIDNGIKVSTTFVDYGREKRGSGMIYSGIYNSTSGKNNLNEFNMAEKITKDLNPSYGSIQALKTRDSDIVALTEDKVLKITTNKDALFNADGNPQLLASNRVLGTAIPFAGDYGISKNPESLASDQYRLYFTDKQRGAVLRLSRDGLTPISEIGMKTWFRKKLAKTNFAIGTFDSINNEYNLTVKKEIAYDSGITVSFNEESKGWVSFKSFIPQAGQSVSGKYATAVSYDIGVTNKEKKGIFNHYTDVVSGGLVSNRNVFYCDTPSIITGNVNNYFMASSVTALFNEMPESVKEFVAVSYEGSQAKISSFATVYNQTQPDGSAFGPATDGEYYNLSSKAGWEVYNITTDLSNSGKATNFKNKEGKWFQFIKGSQIGTQIDNYLEEFNVQGIGNMITPSQTFEFDPTITVQITNPNDGE